MQDWDCSARRFRVWQVPRCFSRVTHAQCWPLPAGLQHQRNTHQGCGAHRRIWITSFSHPIPIQPRSSDPEASLTHRGAGRWRLSWVTSLDPHRGLPQSADAPSFPKSSCQCWATNRAERRGTCPHRPTARRTPRRSRPHPRSRTRTRLRIPKRSNTRLSIPHTRCPLSNSTSNNRSLTLSSGP